MPFFKETGFSAKFVFIREFLIIFDTKFIFWWAKSVVDFKTLMRRLVGLFCHYGFAP